MLMDIRWHFKCTVGLYFLWLLSMACYSTAAMKTHTEYYIWPYFMEYDPRASTTLKKKIKEQRKSGKYKTERGETGGKGRNMEVIVSLWTTPLVKILWAESFMAKAFCMLFWSLSLKQNMRVWTIACRAFQTLCYFQNWERSIHKGGTRVLLQLQSGKHTWEGYISAVPQQSWYLRWQLQ